MGIADGVESLASALAAHVQRARPRDPLLMLFLADVGTMPLWRDIGALDQWEARVKASPIGRETRDPTGHPLSELANKIFAFGCFNLNGTIQADKTRAEFEGVRRLLLQAGILNVPRSAEFDFNVW